MNYTFETLPSGIRVLLAPMADVKSVTTMIFVAAGSRYETPEISGISHFLEHMFFKGTKKRPTSRHISEIVDAVGGEFNAGTSKEYTVYYVKAASSHLKLSLDVLSDMMLGSKFDAKEIESEKGVILEELKMYEDMPMRDIDEIYEGLVYGDQPLGWKTVGSRATISATTRTKMLKYKESLYTQDNIIIGLAGNFDADKARAMIDKYFAGLPKHKKVTWQPLTGRQTKPRVLFIPKKVEQAHLCLGVRGFARGDKDEYAAKVMNVVLGSNMSSRLFIELREKHKLCYYVHSSINTYHDAGSFDIQAGVDLNRIELAVERILHELKKIRDGGVTPKEFKNAKEYMKGKLALGLEDTDSVIEWLGMQQLMRNKIRSVEEVVAMINAVTPEQMQKVAARLFQTNRLNLALIAPQEKTSQERLLKLLQLD